MDACNSLVEKYGVFSDGLKVFQAFSAMDNEVPWQ